ncbi:MAG: hypothetical protein RLZZ111_394 [Planctomycetota bacterium]|jgi:hypothetical protein
MTRPETSPDLDVTARDLPAGEAADHDAPAAALGEVWTLLDSLPPARVSTDLMATTVEMAAVPLRPNGRTLTTASGGTWGSTPPGAFALPGGFTLPHWLPAAAVLLGSLVGGLVVGRASLPNPDQTLLQNLPCIEQFDLLREAGSVAFLEEVARRGYPAPRRPPPAQSPADVRADAEQFDAAIASLRAADVTATDRATVAARREQVVRMVDSRRRQLEKSVESYQRLPPSDRRDLLAVGRALADPKREQLLEAARRWHQWVRLRDPADRRDVIELGTEDRLEWLDRWTRLDAKLENRDFMRENIRDNARQLFEREWENRRRPGGGEPRDRPPELRPGPTRPRGPVENRP